MEHFPKELPGFTLEREQFYPEYQMTMALYRNKKYGFPFVTARNPQDNHNSFCIVFKTPPIDDSGCNHMLEHMVLQGSDKYPIRDVFNELYKRSFSTYMNAGTAPDFTEYPFATINESDFFSDLDVYLDATFHPRLLELEFKKECHSVCFQDNDPTKPLIHNGVVYNEMCGDFSSSNTRYRYAFYQNLYPDCSLKYIFGGDPKMITKASVDDLRRTHQQFYHPSNSYFIHYGTFDIVRIATKICETIDSFPTDFKPIDPMLFEQPFWTEPRKCTIPLALTEIVGPADRQYRATVGWLSIPLKEDQRVTELSFLASFLYDSKNSVLYKRFIKTGRATSLGMTGFHPNRNYPAFIIEIKCCDKETAENFETELMELLTDVEKNGIDPEIIHSSIHQNDLLSLRPTANFGIKEINNQFSSGFFHGADPFRLIGVSEIDRIKKAYKENPRFYQDVIKKYLIDNTHRLFSIGIPTPDLIEKDNQQVIEELAEMKEKLTEEDIQRMKKESEEMNEYLAEPLPLSKLPQIHRNDLQKEADYTSVSQTACNGKIKVFHKPTHGLTFINLIVRIDWNSKFFQENPQYYQLMSTFLFLYGQLGVGDKSDEEWARFVESFSSGALRLALSLSAPKDDSSKNNSFLQLGFYFLNEDIDIAYKAINEFIRLPKFDDLKLIEILLKRKYIQKANNFQTSPCSYAIGLGTLGETQNPTLILDEINFGLSNLRLLNNIVKEQNWEKISQQMKEIYKNIFLNSYFEMVISCEESQAEKSISTFSPLFDNLGSNTVPQPLSSFPEDVKSSLFIDPTKAPDQKVFVQTETNTNFCVICCDVPCRIDKTNVIFSVLSKVLINEFLYEEIRVKLGAYGIETYFNTFLGKFVIYTYRDQHADACLKAILNGLDEIANGNIDDDMVERALIKFFSQLDKPEPPQSQGLFHCIHNITKEDTQKRRDTAYNVTKEDIVNAAKFVKSKKPSFIIISSSSIEPPPKGFTVFRADFSSGNNEEEEEDDDE